MQTITIEIEGSKAGLLCEKAVKAFIFLCLVILSAISTSYAETSTYSPAYKALKKIEAMVQSGVNYTEYGKVVSEATLEINLAEDNLEKLNKILNYYQMAKELWGGKFVLLRLKSANVDNLTVEELTKNIKEAGRLTNNLYKVTKLFPEFNFQLIDPKERDIDIAMQLLWTEASRLLREY